MVRKILRPLVFSNFFEPNNTCLDSLITNSDVSDDKVMKTRPKMAAILDEILAIKILIVIETS